MWPAGAHDASSKLDKIGQSTNATGTTAMGTGLIPVTEALAKALDPIITTIGNWVTEHPKLTDAIIIGTLAFLGFVTALAAVGVYVITVSAALPALGALITAIGVVVTAVSGRWLALGLVVAAFTVVVIPDHQKIWDFIKTMWVDVENIWKTTWNDIASFTKTLLDQVGGYFTNLYNTYIAPVLNAITSVGNAIGKEVGAVGNAVGGAVGGIGNLIGGALSAFADGGIVNGPTLALVGEAGPGSYNTTISFQWRIISRR